MKKTHIIGLIVIAICIGVIVSTSGDTSAYVTFKDAAEMAADGNKNKVHVVGKVKKDGNGQLTDFYYKPEMDPNYFAFKLIDQNNQEQEVVYLNPKPQDFERAEQIVVIGSTQDKIFKADKILMKCPSKYEEKELKAN